MSLLNYILRSRRIWLAYAHHLTASTEIYGLNRFVEDRWKPDVYPSLKFSSKKYYDNMVNTHLMPVFGETQLRSITRESVQNFLAAKVESGSSWKTVKHIRTVFGTILEAAVRDDLLISNPVRRTRLPRRGVGIFFAA